MITMTISRISPVTVKMIIRTTRGLITTFLLLIRFFALIFLDIHTPPRRPNDLIFIPFLKVFILFLKLIPVSFTPRVMKLNLVLTISVLLVILF